MKILVTGSSGVIGKELLPYLECNDVLCVDKVYPEKELPKFCKFFKARLGVVDNNIISKFNPEIVFHLAASFERFQENLEFYETNFIDNILCSRFVIRNTHPKTFIFASSYLIYRLSAINHIMLESAEVSPRNLCGMSKLYIENELNFLKTYSRPEINIINARIFRSYGKGSRDIVSRWIRSALNNESVKIINDKNSFDFVYAGDVARSLFYLSQINKTVTVNIGTGISSSIKHIYSTIANQFNNGNKFLKSETTTDLSGKENTCADILNLKSYIKYAPDTSVEKGVKKILQFEQERNKK